MALDEAGKIVLDEAGEVALDDNTGVGITLLDELICGFVSPGLGSAGMKSLMRSHAVKSVETAATPKIEAFENFFVLFIRVSSC